MHLTPRRVLLAVLIVTAQLVGQRSQDLEDLDREIEARQGELESIRNDIDLLNQRIAEQEQEERDALTALRDLEERISLTDRLRTSLESEAGQLTERINLTQQSIIENEARIDTMKQELAARLVHVYKQKRASLLELILTSENLNEAAYRIIYLRTAVDSNRDLINRILQDVEELHNQQQQLAEDRNRIRESLREKETEDSLLAEIRVERQNQIRSIVTNRQYDERRLLEKEQAAVNLERIIANLEFDREQRAAELEEMRRQRDLASVANIEAYKGRLPWPSSGSVVTSFGQQRNPQLNTITEYPGIDIRTLPDAEVRAVLDGLVTTITYQRGFGTTVIIDHGLGLYTVYALLEDIAVYEGQYVDQGQVIARVGASDGLEDFRLHFEVYVNQQNMDPMDWLVSRY